MVTTTMQTRPTGLKLDIPSMMNTVPSPEDKLTDFDDCPCGYIPLSHFSWNTGLMLSDEVHRLAASINDNMHLYPTSRVFSDELTAEDLAMLAAPYDVLEPDDESTDSTVVGDDIPTYTSQTWINSQPPPYESAVHDFECDWEKYGTMEWLSACPTPPSPTETISHTCSATTLKDTEMDTETEMDPSPRALRADNTDLNLSDDIYLSLPENIAYAYAPNMPPWPTEESVTVPSAANDPYLFLQVEFYTDSDSDMADAPSDDDDDEDTDDSDMEDYSDDDEPGWPRCQYCGHGHNPCAACFD